MMTKSRMLDRLITKKKWIGLQKKEKMQWKYSKEIFGLSIAPYQIVTSQNMYVRLR